MNNKAIIPTAVLAAALNAGCATQTKAPDAPPATTPSTVVNQWHCAAQGKGVPGKARLSVCVPEGNPETAEQVLQDIRLQYALASANTRHMAPGDTRGIQLVSNETGAIITLGPFNHKDLNGNSLQAVLGSWSPTNK